MRRARLELTKILTASLSPNEKKGLVEKIDPSMIQALVDSRMKIEQVSYKFFRVVQLN